LASPSSAPGPTVAPTVPASLGRDHSAAAPTSRQIQRYSAALAEHERGALVGHLAPTSTRSSTLNFYLSAVDEQLRHEHLLCKTNNRVIAEYALRDV
jgi:hypothetical protein